MRPYPALLAFGLTLCVPLVPALAQTAPAAPAAAAVTPAAPTPPMHATHHRAHHPRMSFAERFKRANTTGDGHLTRAQAKAGHMPAIARHFDRIDTQHRGYVTMADIKSYYKEMRAKRHAAYEARRKAGQG
ncbi:MAG: hypothetical protein KGL12_03570 [Rhodospirillales bacterium]|nr:hypothetical protein [Rhodospirillales bacterium]